MPSGSLSHLPVARLLLFSGPTPFRAERGRASRPPPVVETEECPAGEPPTVQPGLPLLKRVVVLCEEATAPPA